MKITINEPCHENWDAMTPNKQGAFCKSCVKDVVDFSKMGIEEIKSFFSSPKSDKVCGRFEEKQLQELSFDDFFAKFTYWNFAKKFAVIFFMAFGFWIFSNSSVIAQSDRHMMKGEVMYVPDKTPKKEPIKKQNPPPVNDKKHIVGKIARTEQICEPTIKGNAKVEEPKIIEEPQMLMGAVAVRPIKEEVIEVITIIETPIKEDVENTIVGQTIVRDSIYQDNIVAQITDESENNLIAGLIAIDDFVDKTEIIVIESIITTDPVASGVEQIADNTTQINIFPNPSPGNFIVETNPSTSSGQAANTKQTVQIFDENGRLVLTQSITGTTTIDASSLNNGIYNALITNGIDDGVIKKRIVIVK